MDKIIRMPVAVEINFTKTPEIQNLLLHPPLEKLLSSHLGRAGKFHLKISMGVTLLKNASKLQSSKEMKNKDTGDEKIQTRRTVGQVLGKIR